MSANIRLYLKEAISPGKRVSLSKYHINYLINVMRLKDSDLIKVFNEDGEWIAKLELVNKKVNTLHIDRCIRQPEAENELHLAFCPIKAVNTSFIIQKATELGVTHIWPLISNRTIVNKVNLEKLDIIAIEASEQCERLSIPKIHQIQKLENFINSKPFEGDLVVCIERSYHDTLDILKNLSYLDNCILVGPEGGFDESEIKLFKNTKIISLGKRILRAETAIIYALSVYNLFMHT